jgi:hypothetical protein
MTDITMHMLLEHQQAMKIELLQQMRDMRKELVSELRTDMRNMERRLTRQIDGIDKRLDAIEIEELPKRVSRIERDRNLMPIA